MAVLIFLCVLAIFAGVARNGQAILGGPVPLGPAPARWLLPLLVPLALLGAPAAAAAPAQPLVLSPAARSVTLAGRLALYYDATNRARLETLASAAADPFQPLAHSIGLGYRAGTAWLRFTLLRPAASPAEWWLEVQRPALDEVALYRPDEAGGWAAETLGDQAPWAGRAVPAINSVFVLELPAGVPQTYYLRLRSTSSLSAALRLWRPAAFAEAQARQLALLGGFAMTALVIALIGLELAWTMRDRLHLIYAAYVLCLAAWLLCVSGVVQFLLASPLAIRLESPIGLLHPALMGLMALLTRELLQLSRSAPRLDRLYRTGAWLLPLVGALAVAGGFDAALKPWLWWLLLGELLGNLVLALWLGSRRQRAARFYLMAFGVPMLAAVWTLLSSLGLTAGREWNYNLTILGTLLHMVLMQLTVSDRVQRARRAHDAARERALRTEQRATARLDEEVAHRTAALSRTLAELESAHSRLAAAHARQSETSGQLTRAKETAEQALAEQRQLMAMMSHELRSPLAAIDAAAQLLAVRHDADPTIAQPLARIRRGSGRVRHFLDNCLTGERIASDRLALSRQSVALPRLARAALEAAELGAAPGRLRLVCPAVLPPLAGDPELLAILLHNLLENALKYSPADTAVTLTVAVDEAVARLAVADRGPGIPADEQPLVFQKYRRGRQAGAIPGAGLGLALVARICALHGGQIELASPPGQGTLITVTLPLQPPPEPPP